MMAMLSFSLRFLARRMAGAAKVAAPAIAAVPKKRRRFIDRAVLARLLRVFGMIVRLVEGSAVLG